MEMCSLFTAMVSSNMTWARNSSADVSTVAAVACQKNLPSFFANFSTFPIRDGTRARDEKSEEHEMCVVSFAFFGMVLSLHFSYPSLFVQSHQR